LGTGSSACTVEQPGGARPASPSEGNDTIVVGSDMRTPRLITARTAPDEGSPKCTLRWAASAGG
jgi:hypothetical protein